MRRQSEAATALCPSAERPLGPLALVQVPAAAASNAAEAAPAKQANQPLPQGCGELVLVVDDEATMRQVTRNILERNGYRTLDAANGAEGLTQFVQKSELTVIDG